MKQRTVLLLQRAAAVRLEKRDREFVLWSGLTLHCGVFSSCVSRHNQPDAGFSVCVCVCLCVCACARACVLALETVARLSSSCRGDKPSPHQDRINPQIIAFKVKPLVFERMNAQCINCTLDDRLENVLM